MKPENLANWQVHVASTELDLIDSANDSSYSNPSGTTNFTVVAGANASIVVRLYDK